MRAPMPVCQQIWHVWQSQVLIINKADIRWRMRTDLTELPMGRKAEVVMEAAIV